MAGGGRLALPPVRPRPRGLWGDLAEAWNGEKGGGAGAKEPGPAVGWICEKMDARAELITDDAENRIRNGAEPWVGMLDRETSVRGVAVRI
jgi:hypothetical protein